MARTDAEMPSALDLGEEVILEGRQHFFFLLVRLAVPAIILSLPVVLGVRDLLVWLFVGPLAFLLFLWFYLDWQDDWWVLTNRRLIRRTRTYLFYESREEVPLSQIQEVAEVWPSMLARLIGYGDLVVRSAASQGGLVLSGIPRPDEVKREILAEAEEVGRTIPVESVEKEEIPREMVEESTAKSSPEKGSVPGRPLPFLDYFFPRLRLEADGQVTWRKHWYVLLGKLAAPLSLLILLGEIWVGAALDLPLMRFIPPGLALALAPPLALVLLLVLIYRYEDWRNDIYVLTPDRIIDIEKKPFLFGEERREASLGMVQDVKYEIPGFFANLLNTGTVIIQTAASEGSFTFDWVHNPRQVQHEIFSNLEAYRERQREEERQARLEEIRQVLDAYRETSGGSEKPSG